MSSWLKSACACFAKLTFSFKCFDPPFLLGRIGNYEFMIVGLFASFSCGKTRGSDRMKGKGIRMRRGSFATHKVLTFLMIHLEGIISFQFVSLMELLIKLQRGAFFNISAFFLSSVLVPCALDLGVPWRNDC